MDWCITSQARWHRHDNDMKSAPVRRALFLFPTDQMGGAERVTRMLAEAALKSDRFDEVTCFVVARPPQGMLNALAKHPRARVIHTSARKEFLGIPKLLRLLASEHFELVFSSHTHLNAFASLARRLGLLRTRHLVTRESTLIFERKMGWRGSVIRSLYRFYGAQDLIVCQTQRMAASLAHHTQHRFDPITTTLANPIDLPAIASARLLPAPQLDHIPKTAFKIVWCGRLASVKSPIRAIETLEELHRAGKTDAHLVMIGDGPMRDQIASHAQKLGIAAHLTLAGYHPAPATLMQHCQVGLMTSDVEGFPNVILEMLAAGVAFIVTTDCAGDLTEIPNTAITNKKTSSDLAQKILDQTINSPFKTNVDRHLKERDPTEFIRRITQ
jgi:glycosyltransferase involved in cell wall biosynthesis